VIGVYIHVPYCTVRCSYCDFYLVPARGRDLEAFAGALMAEIARAGRRLQGLEADSVHFGGGTPSRLPVARLAAILDTVRRAFHVAPAGEIALEANPEDLDPATAAALTVAGFRRVAIGVQTFDDALLRLLRRPHDSGRAEAAITAARRAGFASVAADLIAGLPGQTETSVVADARRLAGLGADHISVYLLEVHERTRLGREIALGRLVPASPDAAADQYEAVAAALEGLGYEHYEISNFARPGHQSRHNLKYWTDQDYLGFGPAAHSRLGQERWASAPDLDAYLASDGAPLRIDDPQPPLVRGLEALVTGLRLTEGVDLAGLAARYGPGLPHPGDAAIRDMVQAGLLVVSGSRLALTRRGRLVSNEIFERLMPERGPQLM
jgi:oxygen-independent coproporphyrinogen-3 oxidase